ncbi:MAG: NADH-quinone oxidoreductase subunit L [Anaerolineae bacterium]
MDFELWILLFPLLGVLINGFLGRRIGKKWVGQVACGAVGLSFLVGIGVFFTLLLGSGEHGRIVPLFSWITVGDFRIEAAILVDQLSTLMTLVVTGVGFLIHVYSVGYMAEDERYARFFTLLNLFVFSMLILVLADNFLLLYVGWELVGLCSYLLIGFWFERPAAAEAGKKAFLVTRIGDFGFALGVMLIFVTFGTLGYAQVFEQAPHTLTTSLATAITLLLFAGAVGKSAQIPLYVWLPDAMEGPTPVSALIHAATMVTAGVYMVARTHALFELAPVSMTLVAAIGAVTAFYAATIALVQNDIKRLLAYSTISQLGYMFLAVGVGAYASGIFHLTTHAFFKALLFLGAGSVMHGLSGELDMRKMGGLKDKMRTTYRTFLAGAAALAGFPLLSGFFSKDEILWRAFNSSIVLWLIGIVTAFLTAFYTFRAVFLTFWGPSRVDKELHIHESPRIMTTPLTILAVLALVGGLIGIPHLSAIEGFLEPVFAHHEAVLPPLGPPQPWGGSGILEWVLMALSAIVAIVAIILAQYMYLVNPGLPERLSQRYASLYKLLSNKYYVDEIYMAWIVNPLRNFAGFLSQVLDAGIIDGAVNSLAAFFGWSGEETRKLQTGYVRNYGLAMLVGVVVVLGYLILR